MNHHKMRPHRKKGHDVPLNSLHKEAEANLINHKNNFIITTGDRCLEDEY